MSRPRDDRGEELVSAVLGDTASNVHIGFVAWEDEGDLRPLNEILRRVFDGTHCPSITAVPDTGSDAAVFVVYGLGILTPGEAQTAWDDYEATYLHGDEYDPEETE